MLPDASALQHIAFLYFGFRSGGLLLVLWLLPSSSEDLSIEVLLNLLLTGLLLFLERCEITLASIAIFALSLLARLLLLLSLMSAIYPVLFHGYPCTFFARSANMSVTSSTSLSSPVSPAC